jgi:hypothetical protein
MDIEAKVDSMNKFLSEYIKLCLKHGYFLDSANLEVVKLSPNEVIEYVESLACEASDSLKMEFEQELTGEYKKLKERLMSLVSPKNK